MANVTGTQTTTATPTERAVRAPKQYGQHSAFRNVAEGIGKLRGTAPAERTLHQGGVDQARLNTIGTRVTAGGITGAPGAEDLVKNKSLKQRMAMKAAANSFGAMAYKGAFGGNGLVARGVTQATTKITVPDALASKAPPAATPAPTTTNAPTISTLPPSNPPSPAPSVRPTTPPSASPSTTPSSIPTPVQSGLVAAAPPGNLRGLQSVGNAAAPDPSLADRTKGFNKTVFLNLISSALHGAAQASAAPDDSTPRMVKGPSAVDVTAKDVAASFAPFGRRLVKDMGSVRAATTALSAGVGQLGGTAYVFGRHVETAANSIGAYAAGRRAGAGTAEIVFTRRAEADWSVQTPIRNNNGKPIGSITSHPEPVTKPDGRQELGKVRVYDGSAAHEITVHRPSAHGQTIDVAPLDKSSSAKPKELTTSDRVGLWSKGVVGDWSGNDSIKDKFAKNLPTSATLTKMAAHTTAIAAASLAQPLISEAAKAVLERIGVPPNVAPYAASLATGIAADAIIAGIFIPGFQNYGNEAKSAGEVTLKVVGAAIPVMNATGTGFQEHSKNVVMDDVTFARTAANETEMLAILAEQLPGSVSFNAGSGTLELSKPDHILVYSNNYHTSSSAAVVMGNASNASATDTSTMPQQATTAASQPSQPVQPATPTVAPRRSSSAPQDETNDQKNAAPTTTKRSRSV